MAEHDHCKFGVAGSTPVSGSILLSDKDVLEIARHSTLTCDTIYRYLSISNEDLYQPIRGVPELKKTTAPPKNPKGPTNNIPLKKQKNPGR